MDFYSQKKRTIVVIVILSLLCIGFFYHCSTTSQIKGKQPSLAPIESITSEELVDHVSYLASDAMNGRTTGSEEYRIAALYVAEEFRKAGLKPIVRNAQGKLSFLQPVPLYLRLPDDYGTLLVSVDGEEKQFRQGESFKLMFFNAGEFPQESLPVVFAGYGIESAEAGWNDFKDLDLNGKIVVVILGAPIWDGKPVLPDSVHQIYSTRQGTSIRVESVKSRGAAGLLFIASPRLLENWDRIPDYSSQFSLIYTDSCLSKNWRDSNSMTGSHQLIIRDDVVRFLFKNQSIIPDSSYRELNNSYRAFPIENVSISYHSGETGGLQQVPNVIGFVKGTDRKLRDEIIVVGAHLDHVSPQIGFIFDAAATPDTAIFNGADDNASGCAGIMEIAEAVVMNPPKRSVLFALYTGEEIGLIGSLHFLHHGPITKEKMKVNITLDMISRSDPDHQEDRAHLVYNSETIDVGLKDFIVDVNQNTVNWPLEFHSTAPSDHVPFLDENIPSAMFCSGFHEDLHRPTDDVDKIDSEKMQKISQLIYEIVMELGNRKEIPG